VDDHPVTVDHFEVERERHIGTGIAQLDVRRQMSLRIFDDVARINAFDARRRIDQKMRGRVGGVGRVPRNEKAEVRDHRIDARIGRRRGNLPDLSGLQ